MSDQLLERFWDKIEVQSNGCWNWVSTLNSKGYGLFRNKDKKVLSHRFAYKVNKGEMPKNLELDHLCRNTSCVNPDHLEPVSHKENCIRGKIGDNNKLKTHCPKGHEYNYKNTYIDPRGFRNCRKCNIESSKKYRGVKL